MEKTNRGHGDERLLLDLYQEKIRYIMEDRNIDEAWNWQTILQKFKFLPPEKIEIPEHDLRKVFASVEELLQKQPDFQSVSPGTMIAVKKLGKQPVKPNDVKDKNPVIAAALEMGRILSAHPESDIFLRAECLVTDSGEMNTEFKVGSGSLSADSLAAMIRGAYGQVGYKNAKKAKKDYPEKCYAVANTIARNKQELERRDKEQKWESWVTTLLTSLACSREYAVEFCFHPMIEKDGKEQLHKLETALENAYKELAFYHEIGWNNGINGGGNITFQNAKLHNVANNFHFLKNALKDGIQANENYSFSYAENSKVVDQHAKSLMAEIEYQLMNLRQIHNSVGWAVTISAFAADEETIDAVTSIVSGIAESANISLKWQKAPCCAMIASNRDILPFLMFPTKEFAGFEFVENEDFSLVSPVSGEEDGLYVSNILWNGTEVSRFFLPRQALNRHAFICGMTGAGKTNTLFKVMEEIAVPFLVIEPVKGEYRSLQGKYDDTRVWTMRTSDALAEHVGVLQINPFWFPEGANIAFHIDSIKTIISSAFDLSAAMPNIVEQCLYNVYLKAGWNIVTNSNVYHDILPEEYLYPTFSDLTNEVADYLNKSDFGEEVLGNYKGALLSRLKSFTNGTKGALLNTAKHPDYRTVMDGRNIIELEGLADDADKCLVMGTILVQYYQYLKGHFHDQDKKKNLKHIIVIEEAHRLFKNVKPQNKGAEGADPTGQLVESLSNIMAEIRAFGEGMLIVDQSPTKIAEDVIKNSGTKIIHRVDNINDIKMMQSAMLMPDNTVGFSSLSQGEALIRSDAMCRPCKVKVLCSDIKENYSLAESFKTGGVADYEINDTFVANTIVQNEQIYVELKEQIGKLFRSFVWMNWNEWYDVVNRFLLEVIQILQDNHVWDMVQGRFDVLTRILSVEIKKMYSATGTKNAGLVHMFTMRLVEFYLDGRAGWKVKPGAVWMLEQFFRDKLCQDVLYSNGRKLFEDVSFLQFVTALKLEDRWELAYLLYSYLCNATGTLKNGESFEDIADCVTVGNFLYSNTFLSVEAYKEQYEELERKLEDLLKDNDFISTVTD